MLIFFHANKNYVKKVFSVLKLKILLRNSENHIFVLILMNKIISIDEKSEI